MTTDPSDADATDAPVGVAGRSGRVRRGAVVAILAAMVVSAAAVTVGFVTRSDPQLTAGTPVPELELSRADGTAFDLDELGGSPMVINFFASWCAPCVVEMPQFETVHRELAGTVTFLGIASTDTLAEEQAVIERTGITYDTARDPKGEAMIALGVPVLPSTIFVDAKGNVVERHLGPLDAQELRALIDEYLLS